MKLKMQWINVQEEGTMRIVSIDPAGKGIPKEKSVV